jgi:hypothetical protein
LFYCTFAALMPACRVAGRGSLMFTKKYGSLWIYGCILYLLLCDLFYECVNLVYWMHVSLVRILICTIMYFDFIIFYHSSIIKLYWIKINVVFMFTFKSNIQQQKVDIRFQSRNNCIQGQKRSIEWIQCKYNFF